MSYLNNEITKNIINNIRTKVKEKFNIDISSSDIDEICKSQAACTIIEMEKESTIKWSYFGKWSVKKGRKDFIEKNLAKGGLTYNPKEVKKNFKLKSI